MAPGEELQAVTEESGPLLHHCDQADTSRRRTCRVTARVLLAAIGVCSAAALALATTDLASHRRGLRFSVAPDGPEVEERDVFAPSRGSTAGVLQRFNLWQVLQLFNLWPRDAKADCCQRLERLEKLNAPEPRLPAHSHHDPDFPPNMDSIGNAKHCGDRAAGISNDCSEFNNWQHMDTVARRYGHSFSVFKPGHLQYHDIGQGKLGTCYMLAALASIVNSRPKLIEDMFVRRERWQEGIYTTRWLINEKETFIEVDDMIPATHDNVAFFVQPSSTGEFWPAILEKAWAKIHTSFAATEGGYWPSPVLAITRAPVHAVYHRKNYLHKLLPIFVQATKNQLWHMMVSSTSMKRPMAASTSSPLANFGKYGLAGGHAYSVFSAYISHQYGKVVEVYNPWNSDNYKGKVPNPSKSDGLFTMTFDEYFDAFISTWIADLEPDYVVTSAKIQHGQDNRWSHHNFQVKGNPKEFYVSITWPGHRLVRPCAMLDPDVTLQVVKADEHGKELSDVFKGSRDGKSISSLTAEVTAGGGSYHIMTNARFSDSNWIDDLFLTVYAPHHVNIVEIAGIAHGDRFHNVGDRVLLTTSWMNSELQMHKEGQLLWKTKNGDGRKLLQGDVVTVHWSDGHTSKVKFEDDKRIRIVSGGHGSFDRAAPNAIPGSSRWWTCRHGHMFVCGPSCCCDRGTKFNEGRGKCRPI